MPNYLVNRIAKAEAEKKATMLEIELNKRPQGTIRLRPDEISNMRQNLNWEKKLLQDKIENMSVTLYTGRAKKENMGLVQKLNEVDKALTVFERDNVYVKN